MQGGYRSDAIRIYQEGMALAMQFPSMEGLVQLHKYNASLLLSWDQEQATWQEFMTYWRSKFLIEAVRPMASRVAIICPYPDMAAGSLIAHDLVLNGIDSQLLYSGALTSFAELPNPLGVVVLGGHLSEEISPIMGPVIKNSDIEKMAISIMSPPGFGIIAFEACGKPAVWLAGQYPWETIACARHWLLDHTDGLIRFIKRLKRTNGVDSLQNDPSNT